MKKYRIMLSVAALITALNLSAGSALNAKAVSQQETAALPAAPSPAAAVSAVSTSGAVAGDFLLLDVNGRVCVYEGDTLLMKTAIDVLSLPASDRAALAQGIHAKDSAELAVYLEDFGS